MQIWKRISSVLYKYHGEERKEEVLRGGGAEEEEERFSTRDIIESPWQRRPQHAPRYRDNDVERRDANIHTPTQKLARIPEALHRLPEWRAIVHQHTSMLVLEYVNSK